MADTGAGAGVPKRIRTKEQMKIKRDGDRARAKTRVNLGFAFERWRELRKSKGMRTDPELALFLLDSYTKGPAASTPSKHAASAEPIMLSSISTDSERDKAEEALPEPFEVETVHGETPSEPQEEDAVEFPDPVAVQHEDDLTGKNACIAYEECLRTLGTFLQLPVLKCPYPDPVTEKKCSRRSPFQVQISRRGTAFVMEWFCSKGHRLWKWNSQPLLKCGMQSGDFMLSTNILLSGNSYAKVALLFKHMNMGMVVSTAFDSVQGVWQRKRAEIVALLKEKKIVLGDDRRDSPGIQQLSLMKEEPSWQQEWSSSLHQENTKPQQEALKEEQEEFWDAQDGKPLQGLEEADTTTFPFNALTVKNEDEEKKPHQRQTDQIETAADEEDCGGAEPDRDSDPESCSVPEIEVKIEDSSEPETDDSDDCPGTWEKQSGLDSDQTHSCTECGKKFNCQGNLMRHKAVHAAEKPHSCSECGKRFTQKHHLIRHRLVHTGEKLFSCSDCGKRYTQKIDLKRHMANHREEKLFSCSECGKTFNRKSNLTAHMLHHKELKPFSCSGCGKRYSDKRSLSRHTLVHTGERPLICSVCSKTFKQQAHLASHMLVHTGEKPFSCSECGKRFYRKWHLTSHTLVHTGGREKRYSCSVCDQRFSWRSQLKKHECVSGQASELQPNQTKEREKRQTQGMRETAVEVQSKRGAQI